MNLKSKTRIIVLSLSMVVFLNSCLAVATLGVLSAGVAVIKLPFQIIGGVFSIFNGSTRDEQIRKVGDTKYTKAIDKIMLSNKKEIKLGAFNAYVFKTLEFKKKKEVLQLVDNNSGITFPFTVSTESYNSISEIEKKMDEFAKLDNVSEVKVTQESGITVSRYDMKVNNKNDKKIEKYRVTFIEKDKDLLIYQYLISSDQSYLLEQQLFENIIDNTFKSI